MAMPQSCKNWRGNRYMKRATNKRVRQATKRAIAKGDEILPNYKQRDGWVD